MCVLISHREILCSTWENAVIKTVTDKALFLRYFSEPSLQERTLRIAETGIDEAVLPETRLTPF